MQPQILRPPCFFPLLPSLSCLFLSPPTARIPTRTHTLTKSQRQVHRSLPRVLLSESVWVCAICSVLVSSLSFQPPSRPSLPCCSLVSTNFERGCDWSPLKAPFYLSQTNFGVSLLFNFKSIQARQVFNCDASATNKGCCGNGVGIVGSVLNPKCLVAEHVAQRKPGKSSQVGRSVGTINNVVRVETGMVFGLRLSPKVGGRG